jgi:uncharacterized ParB-like nuclease family protein
MEGANLLVLRLHDRSAAQPLKRTTTLPPSCQRRERLPHSIGCRHGSCLFAMRVVAPASTLGITASTPQHHVHIAISLLTSPDQAGPGRPQIPVPVRVTGQLYQAFSRCAHHRCHRAARRETAAYYAISASSPAVATLTVLCYLTVGDRHVAGMTDDVFFYFLLFGSHSQSPSEF